MKQSSSTQAQDDQFRKDLETAIKEDNLMAVQQLFIRGAPAGFDINRAHSRPGAWDSPMMQCLTYGASFEIFLFLEERGGDFKACVSGLHDKADGQNIAFARSGNFIVTGSNNIQAFINEGQGSDARIIKKFDNARQILSYIDRNTTTKEKNDLCLLHLCMYYMHDQLFTKLVNESGIDLNKQGARLRDAFTIAAFDTTMPERKHYFDTLLRRDDVQVSNGAMVQILIVESFTTFRIAFEKMVATQNLDNEGIKKKCVLLVQGLSAAVRDLDQKIHYIAARAPDVFHDFLNAKDENGRTLRASQSLTVLEKMVDRVPKTQLQETVISILSSMSDTTLDSNDKLEYLTRKCPTAVKAFLMDGKYEDARDQLSKLTDPGKGSVLDAVQSALTGYQNRSVGTKIQHFLQDVAHDIAAGAQDMLNNARLSWHELVSAYKAPQELTKQVKETPNVAAPQAASEQRLADLSKIKDNPDQHQQVINAGATIQSNITTEEPAETKFSQSSTKSQSESKIQKRQ